MVSDVVQDHKDESLAEGRGAAGGDDIAREVDVALGGGAFGGESSSSDHRRMAITRDVLPFLARQLLWVGNSSKQRVCSLEVDVWFSR